MYQTGMLQMVNNLQVAQSCGIVDKLYRLRLNVEEDNVVYFHCWQLQLRKKLLLQVVH
jgi:hypothetical protein